MGLMDKYIEILDGLNFEDMYNNDFLLTWEKSEDELKAVFTVAERYLIADLEFHYLEITLLELDLVLHQLVIYLDLKFKI